MKLPKYLLTFELIILLASTMTPVHADWNEESNIIFLVSGNLGYNALVKGFPGYTNYVNLGADLYILPRYNANILEEASWTRYFFYRVSFEYFPLVVPEGIYHTTEDIVAITGDLLYPIYRFKSVSFIIGLGIGVYDDIIQIDTPATGKHSGSSIFYGLKPSLAAAIRLNERFELIPEIRYHYVMTVNSYITENVCYQVGLCYRFGESDENL